MNLLCCPTPMFCETVESNCFVVVGSFSSHAGAGSEMPGVYCYAHVAQHVLATSLYGYLKQASG
eukprot:m.43793 g.43793  ORF g.43793 m.43793 type:complete len:64 (+) comp10796_c0_seq1:106-297(+)